MTCTQFNEFLKIHGMPRTDTEGGELALTKLDALKALEFLYGTEVGVLGGDVYELEDNGYFRPTYDNWYCNRDKFSPSEFARISQEKAFQYIKNYHETEGSDVRYVLVIDV